MLARPIRAPAIWVEEFVESRFRSRRETRSHPHIVLV